MEYLSLGKIVDAFGLDGTLKVYSTTTNGEARYQKGAKVFIFNPNDNSETEHTVLNYRHNGMFDFIKLENISDKDDAFSKKGCEIHALKDPNILKKNEYYFSDLRDCKVIDKNKKELGIVSEIEEFPAQITLRVARKGMQDFFVPFINEFILNVNIASKVITIEVIEGML